MVVYKGMSRLLDFCPLRLNSACNNRILIWDFFMLCVCVCVIGVVLVDFVRFDCVAD